MNPTLHKVQTQLHGFLRNCWWYKKSIPDKKM